MNTHQPVTTQVYLPERATLDPGYPSLSSTSTSPAVFMLSSAALRRQAATIGLSIRSILVGGEKPFGSVPNRSHGRSVGFASEFVPAAICAFLFPVVSLTLSCVHCFVFVPICDVCTVKV